MACATLKRALDWESLNQRPSKRRRCNPLGQSSTGNSMSSTHLRSPLKSLVTSNQASNTLSCLHDSPSSSSNLNCGMSGSSFLNNTNRSAFVDATISKISSDKMAQNLCDEIRRLHKRKQLPFSSAAFERMQDSESSGSEMGPDSPRRPDSPPGMLRYPEKALFTFKQVQMICQRMLKEREDELRETYDAVLTNKLAEQYDVFVKFTYDQIQRRYEAAPSYLS